MTTPEPDIQQIYEDCVESCADSLYRVAYRLTGNPALANELVQETYLAAWKNLASLTDPGKMRSWMFAILRNQYTKLIRKESKAAKASELAFDVPQQMSSENESIDRVQQAIARLPENHRLPILLVAMEGLSVDDAAGVIGIPKGTVLSRLHRARQKLKELLTENDGESYTTKSPS